MRAVPSERYPLNSVCAHPECTEPAVDPHHCFPRSEIGGDSWFVEVTYDDNGVENETLGSKPEGEVKTVVIPHVAGLCRSHHEEVEVHNAWIKLEGGTWVWYDRETVFATMEGAVAGELAPEWTEIGALNPQPGSAVGTAKRKKRNLKGEARRGRATISLKVPQDEREDGAGLFDEYLDMAEEKLTRPRSASGQYDDADGWKPRPRYNTIIELAHFFNENFDPEVDG